MWHSTAVYTRALISCCVVAQAQHLGQNSRFAQQQPRGWLRAAQHAILGAQHFSPQAIFFVARTFFAVGEKKKWGLFSTSPEALFVFGNLFMYFSICCVCNMETT